MSRRWLTAMALATDALFIELRDDFTSSLYQVRRDVKNRF
jgi:hypothetical protein